MIIVEVVHLTHRFRSTAKPVLGDVGFAAGSGESIAVIGRLKNCWQIFNLLFSITDKIYTSILVNYTVFFKSFT